MYEVIYIKKGKEPKFQYVKHMNLNGERLPVPYRIATVHEFRKQFADCVPSHVEYRTIIIRKEHMSAKIFYFSDCAYAMVFDLKSHMNKDNHLVYDKPILYYKIGCEHNYIELTKEQCFERNLIHFGLLWHVNLCKKCGMIKVVK